MMMMMMTHQLHTHCSCYAGCVAFDVVRFDVVWCGAAQSLSIGDSNRKATGDSALGACLPYASMQYGVASMQYGVIASTA